VDRRGSGIQIRSSWATVLQDDVDFLVSSGTVLDAARNDDKFAFVDDGFVAAELHPQSTFHDQKQFVFVVMMMPDEFAF